MSQRLKRVGRAAKCRARLTRACVRSFPFRAYQLEIQQLRAIGGDVDERMGRVVVGPGNLDHPRASHDAPSDSQEKSCVDEDVHISCTSE